MYRKITATVAATIMVIALLGTIVTASAQADASANVKKTIWAKGNTDYIYEVQVTNNGDELIENVTIERPGPT